jgi:hypothetical protein
VGACDFFTPKYIMNLIRPLSFFLVIYTTLVAMPRPSEIEASWIENQLPKTGPRLIWQEGDEALIKKRIHEDSVAQAYYDLIISQADALLEVAPSERIVVGRRLLSVSRNVLKRTSVLGFAWRMTGEKAYLDRLNDEVLAVSAFSDWNPSHFLDVAEMAMAVAIAVDWAGDDLPTRTVRKAKEALIEKGVDTSLTHPSADWWSTADMNWNQVCNAGITAAALVTFAENPENSTAVINRALQGLPHVLETYAPDGIYIEGATYWIYGTGFNVLFLAMLESALGTDFGLAAYPGFMASADFLAHMEAPSGQFYNYFDCSDFTPLNVPLLWFGMKTGEPRAMQGDKIVTYTQSQPDASGHDQRLAPFGLLWYVHSTPSASSELPLSWAGEGENPLAVFRSSHSDPNALYLAAKGGKGSLNHGNMDAGSFIFELDGVRWAIDPGNQNYHHLEEIFKEIGGSLWGNFQDSRRWTLLTKNNFGHNTLTIDGKLHVNDGMAFISEFDAEERFVRFNMLAPLYSGAKKAERTLRVINDRRIEISDEVILQPFSEVLTWQMLTEASVELVEGGAILRQNGKEVKLEIKSPQAVNFSVISLDPPPLSYDKRIPGLKRIELSIPTYSMDNREVTIKVELGD